MEEHDKSFEPGEYISQETSGVSVSVQGMQGVDQNAFWNVHVELNVCC